MVFLSLWMIRRLCQGHGLSVYEIDCLADLYCKIRRTKPRMEMNPRLATLLREYYLGCQLCWSSISQYWKGSVYSSGRCVMSIFCLHGSSGKQVPVDPYWLLWLGIASLVKYLATFHFFLYTRDHKAWAKLVHLGRGSHTRLSSRVLFVSPMMEHGICHSWSTMHWETTVTQVTCLSEGLPELLHIMVYLMLTMVPHFLYLPAGTLQGWPTLGSTVLSYLLSFPMWLVFV